MAKRRSWSTIRDTETARASERLKAEGDREQRTRVGEMLATASRSFTTTDVAKRLDDAAARDLAAFEAKWGKR